MREGTLGSGSPGYAGQRVNTVRFRLGLLPARLSGRALHLAVLAALLILCGCHGADSVLAPRVDHHGLLTMTLGEDCPVGVLAHGEILDCHVDDNASSWQGIVRDMPESAHSICHDAARVIGSLPSSNFFRADFSLSTIHGAAAGTELDIESAWIAVSGIHFNSENPTRANYRTLLHESLHIAGLGHYNPPHWYSSSGMNDFIESNCMPPGGPFPV